MDLDQMKQKWAEQDRKLDETLRLNRQLLTALRLNSGRSRMQRVRAMAILHALAWLGCIVALGDFLYTHAGIAHLAIAAALTDLYAIGMFIAVITQLARIAGIDYQQPVSGIQKQLEAVRILRIRTTQWGVLAGIVIWTPALMVVAQAAAGLDVYRAFSPAWLAANVVFGLTLIPLSIWTARKFAGRIAGSMFLQRIANDLAGRSLTDAAAFLATIADLEKADSR